MRFAPLILDKWYASKPGSMMIEQELRWLLAKVEQTPGDVVEIGTHLGETTRELALTFPARLIHTVDLPEGKGYDTGGRPRGEAAIGLPNVIFYDNGNEFDIPDDVGLVFIDGDHSYEGVSHDTRKATRHFLKREGSIVWHDVHHPNSVPEPDSMMPQILRCLMESGLDIVCVDKTRLAYCDFTYAC